MPAPLPPEWVLQGPECDQTPVPLALGGSDFGETWPLGAGFATVLVLLSPATPPPVVPIVPSGPNLNVTSPRKLSPPGLHSWAAPQKVTHGISTGPCNSTPG